MGVDVVEGEMIEGELSGEIAMVHRSQSPPIDVETRIQIHDRDLRRLAPQAGIEVGADGAANLRLRGTLDAPRISPLREPRE